MSDFDSGETLTAIVIVDEETIIAEINTAARGPAGPAGSAVIDSDTVSDGTAALYVDSIRFETSNGGPTQQGQMAWESTDGSIDAMLESGVIVAVGEDLMIRVRNRTGSQIAKGTALAYDGTTGASGRIFVKPWVGANIPTAKLFVGFAAAAINHNGNGYSQWFGKLDGINTSGGAENWQDEEIIYAVPSASSTLTNIAPTSGEYAAAAVVVNAGSGTSGILFVRPTFESASSTSATANTLVLRDGSGGASFQALNAASFEAGTIEATTLLQTTALAATGNAAFQGSVEFQTEDFTYGGGAASAHRIALGAGTTGAELFQAATAEAARTELGVRTLIKSTDESKTNDATYAADAELKDIPLEAGKSYKIEFFIGAYVPVTEGGKVRILVPLQAGTQPGQVGIYATSQWGNGSPGNVGTSTVGAPSGFRYIQLAANSGHNQNRALTGFAYTGILASSGNLSLEWAQNTSGVNATILLAGSLITVTEL